MEIFDNRLTEQRNPDTVDIDSADAGRIVDLINAEDRKVPEAVHGQRGEIARAIDLAVAAFRAGGRLIYVGAGTSGRLGVLDSAECPPTFGVEPDMVRGIIAGGYMALLRSQEGAEDQADSGAVAMDEAGVGGRDFVLGIAASSTTAFVRGALKRAAALGARTGLLCCTDPGAEMRELVDVSIVPLVGPEVITGSTRMKAGTATKLVLNTISTGAMILLGKVYQNLMVDLQAVSQKLVDRGERIVMAVTGATREQAGAVIAAAGGSVKTAVLMQKADIGRELAELAIAEAEGSIRVALSRESAVEGASTQDPFTLYGDRLPNDESLARLLYALRQTPKTVSELARTADDEALTGNAGGGWCAKEHIEHMIAHDLVVDERLRLLQTEDKPTLSASERDGQENAAISASPAPEARAALLLMRLTDGRARLMARVEAIDADDFGRRGAIQGSDEEVTIYQLLRQLARHDDRHIGAIRRRVHF